MKFPSPDQMDAIIGWASLVGFLVLLVLNANGVLA